MPSACERSDFEQKQEVTINYITTVNFFFFKKESIRAMCTVGLSEHYGRTVSKVPGEISPFGLTNAFCLIKISIYQQAEHTWVKTRMEPSVSF